MIEWSSSMWLVSVLAVLLSALVAWGEGNWGRRPGLDMGFREHGGMWGDLALLPVANAVIWPWIEQGWWLLLPLLAATAWSLGLHVWWHAGQPKATSDHMWPRRRHVHWARDLSLSGWCHVLYVATEIALLLAYVWASVPAAVVWIVSFVLTLHVPLGLLQPAWYAERRTFSRGIRTMLVALAMVWATAFLKLTA